MGACPSTCSSSSSGELGSIVDSMVELGSSGVPSSSSSSGALGSMVELVCNHFLERVN